MSGASNTMYEFEKAKRFVLDHDRFLVVSHVHPDGDAAGSTFAVGLLLKALGKSYTLANADPIPDVFSYMEGYDTVCRIEGEQSYSHVIAVDCADYARIGNASSWLTDNALILNIDHHSTNDGYGHVNLINVQAAATVEVLHELILSLDVSWTKELATCIYTGLLTDTGGFRYSNTTPDVMAIASRMLEFGAEGYRLAEHLLERIEYSHILLLRRALSTLNFELDRTICWMRITQQDMVDTEANQHDTEGLVNYARNIAGVRVGLLFKETGPEEVKLSFRSDGSFDVAQFAKSLGGGGHARAAGCTLTLNISDAEQTVITRLRESLAL